MAYIYIEQFGGASLGLKAMTRGYIIQTTRNKSKSLEPLSVVAIGTIVRPGKAVNLSLARDKLCCYSCNSRQPHKFGLDGFFKEALTRRDYFITL